MCHCDLKRALDQALFARQFRQLDAAPAYSPIAPPAPHFHPAPYRTPARPPYAQVTRQQRLQAPPREVQNKDA